ncbi:hypothetical protein L1987_30992 [Smallanthus sonchifolius]|uniref:Uncharacterized protein n=1 Tax=Smallanthus sonchifolius TaxID=185202 RepID=A0ACB9I4Y6_9ASTR|nr:hypothetical protein L1987_30992 [Smallanthus sonchifolius]
MLNDLRDLELVFVFFSIDLAVKLLLMALLDTPDIGDSTTTTAIRGELRRRKSVKADAGFEIGDGLYDSSSSSRTNSSDDGDSLNNVFNENDKQQIGAGDETRGNEEKIDQGGVKKEGETSVLQYAYRPSSPAHRRIKESPLSSDAIFKQPILDTVKIMVDHIILAHSSRSLRDWPLLMCCISLLIFPLTAYLVEKLAWKKRILDPIYALGFTSVKMVNGCVGELGDGFDSAVLSGVSLMLCACINWLKLTSFVHTNYDMRSLVNSTDKGAAILIAFFMSAVFHELCIAVPCHIFKFWAFIGIMFQVLTTCS